MPFFSNKFSPKRIPARKLDTNIVSRELGPDYATRELSLDIPPIKLILAKREFIFEDGQWISEFKSPGSSHRDEAKTKKSLKLIEEENNLMTLKFEILLDMLTQATAESQLQLKEIDFLKQSNKTSNNKTKS